MDKQQERRQDHFNKAYLGVIAQGRPAYDRSVNGGMCLYFDARDGSKCNVGHILTDAELSAYGSFLGSVEELGREMLDHGDIDEDHPFRSDWTFYSHLQKVHDNLWGLSGGDFVKFFKQDMGDFAKKYNLTVPDETATA